MGTQLAVVIATAALAMLQEEAHADTVYTWNDGGDQTLWSDDANWSPAGPIVVVAPDTKVDIEVGALGVTGNYTQTVDTATTKAAGQPNTCSDVWLYGHSNAFTLVTTLEMDGTPRFDGESTMTMNTGSSVGFSGVIVVRHGFDVTLNGTARMWANDNQAHITYDTGATATINDGAQLDCGTRGFFAVNDVGSIVTMEGATALIRNGETDVRNGGKLVVNAGTFNWNNRNNRIDIDNGEILIHGGTFQMGNNINFNNAPGLIRLDGGTRTGATAFNVNFLPNSATVGEQNLVIGGIDSFVTSGTLKFGAVDPDVTAVVTVEGTETASIGFGSLDNALGAGVLRFIPNGTNVTPIAFAQPIDISNISLDLDLSSLATTSYVVLVTGGGITGPFANVTGLEGAWELDYTANQVGLFIDADAPTPSPMTWAVAPTAITETAITMTATKAMDRSGVQYFFTNSVNGTVSGWQADATWTDTGLSPNTTYRYRVKARDQSPSLNETAWSEEKSAETLGIDTNPPTPSPMTWAVVPTAVNSFEITMTATTATDPSGVEYFFACTGGGGNNSDWQDQATYTDTGLSPNTEYTYTVRARDKSPARNTTLVSVGASDTTGAPDLTAPSPSPMTWATVPVAVSKTGITMTATIAIDPSRVQYFFTNTVNGHVSGWQADTNWTDMGLSPGTTNRYRVKARDESPNLNETAWSEEREAVTLPQVTVWTGAIDTDITKAGNWDDGLPAAANPGVVLDGFAVTGAANVDEIGKTVTFYGNSTYYCPNWIYINGGANFTFNDASTLTTPAGKDTWVGSSAGGGDGGGLGGGELHLNSTGSHFSKGLFIGTRSTGLVTQSAGTFTVVKNNGASVLIGAHGTYRMSGGKVVAISGAGGMSVASGGLFEISGGVAKLGTLEITTGGFVDFTAASTGTLYVLNKTVADLETYVRNGDITLAGTAVEPSKFNITAIAGTGGEFDGYTELKATHVPESRGTMLLVR